MKHRQRLEELWFVQSGICHICKGRVPPPGSIHPQDDYAPTADHVKPRSMRHPKDTGQGNFLMAHKRCNEIRGNPRPSLRLVILAELVEAARRALRHTRLGEFER